MEINTFSKQREKMKKLCSICILVLLCKIIMTKIIFVKCDERKRKIQKAK